MHISEKIDFKKYVLYSTPLLVISYLLARNSAELKVMAMVFLAACLNQWMLVNGVSKLVKGAADEEQPSKGNLLLMFIGKIFVLVVALTLGVQTMGKRIIIPLLIYVLQIVVLYLSLKKKGSEQ
jgi:hypothetical protein